MACAEEDGLVGADRIEDRANILHLGFERGPHPWSIRHPDASLVEEDQAREGSEPGAEFAKDGEEVPGEDHARREGNEDEVSWTISDDVVGDGGIPALRVTNVGRLHRVSLSLGG